MSNNGFNFGFKPIEEFTFDECFVRIEQNRVDGVESDEQLLERYSVLLSQLQQKDDEMFRKSTGSKSSLENYIASYPLYRTAKNYQLRHVAQAKEFIGQIEAYSKRRKKKAVTITLSVIGVIAIIVCWLNYTPVKYINVDESLSITKYGDSIRVIAQTNVPSHLIKMNVESGSDWLQVSGEDGNYTLVAKPNPIGSRYATIKISAPNRLFGSVISCDSKTISISQESGEPSYINLERTSMSFDKFGKAIDKPCFIITTDGVLENVSSSPEWSKVSFEPIDNNRIKCTVSLDINEGNRKTGDIIFKGGNITANLALYQESGLATRISFTNSSVSVPASNNTQFASIITDGTSWSVSSTPSWIKTSIEEGNSLKMVIEENEGGKRPGIVRVISNNGQTASLTVNQATSLASYIRAGQSSLNAGKSGIDKYIPVSTDGKSWSIYSSPSWLTVSKNDDNTKIYVEIPTNAGKMKEGEIILASNNGHHATITVKQDGDPTNFSAGKSSIRFDSGSDYEYVNISNNSNQSLRVDESKSWITASATSKGQIKISVSSNSNSARSGYVTVRCGNESCRIDVRQSGWTDCYYCGGRGQVQCGYPALWMNGLHCVQEFVMNYYTGGGYYTYNPCPNCGGSGGVTCSHCHGEGKIKSN